MDIPGWTVFIKMALVLLAVWLLFFTPVGVGIANAGAKLIGISAIRPG